VSKLNCCWWRVDVLAPLRTTGNRIVYGVYVPRAYALTVQFRQKRHIAEFRACTKIFRVGKQGCLDNATVRKVVVKGSTNAPAHFQSSAVVVRSVANDAGSSNAFGGWGAPPWGNANLCTCVTLQLLVVERQSKLFQTRLIRSFLFQHTLKVYCFTRP
jgi:hypothetical protein